MFSEDLPPGCAPEKKKNATKTQKAVRLEDCLIKSLLLFSERAIYHHPHPLCAPLDGDILAGLHEIGGYPPP